MKASASSPRWPEQARPQLGQSEPQSCGRRRRPGGLGYPEKDLVGRRVSGGHSPLGWDCAQRQYLPTGTMSQGDGPGPIEAPWLISF